MNLNPNYLARFVSESPDRTPPMRVFVYTYNKSCEDYSYSVPGGFQLDQYLMAQFSDRNVSIRPMGIRDESGLGHGVVVTMYDDDGRAMEEHRGLYE